MSPQINMKAKRTKNLDITHLSNEESRRFAKALISLPRTPTKRFKKALRLYRASVTEL